MRKRLIYLDWLRVVSIIGVITIHVAAGLVTVNLMEVPKSNWLAANFFESLTRAAVPLFVMISGALFLSDKRELTYKEFFLKRASKVFVPLVGWSIIYYLYLVSRGDFAAISLKKFVYLFITQGISTHFWFMYMILGVYLTIPLIKLIIKQAKRSDLEYFLLLWFYASIVVKFMKFYFGWSLNLELFMVTNYVGYFILGYYLATYDFLKILRLAAYIGGLIGIAATFLLTWKDTVAANGVLQEFWYEYHSPNVFLAAVGVFLLVKHMIKADKERLPFIFRPINQNSFGIYLIHILVMQVLGDELFAPIKATFHPFLAIILNVFGVVLISTLIVMVMRKIPLINKLVP